MTHPVRVGRAEIVRLPGDRAAVTGTLAEVSAVLAAVQRSGRLLSASPPVPMPGRPGVILVNARLVPPMRPAPPTPPRRRIHPGAVAAVLAAAAVFLGVVVWAALTVLAWVVAHAAVVVGAVIAVVVLLAVAGRRCCETVVTVTHRHR